ncbi:MAG: exopolysaccharide biosynthesis polyprenyl glycosylphosphotransferase [Candidatus Pacebacteria bacterium]|nr:exopolysaccharide biosynthesis polyprenyl glycosylphosphotransferase [Candidatus Paceibacterota bacterium]MDD5357431.1 exopolysaccharide biosynthesis polyprenyl glycosylphosphotransferase [Candidatus Paceibacterota bacterium]
MKDNCSGRFFVVVSLHMVTSHKKEPFLLFVGDFVSFLIALWVMLVFRYGSIPSRELFISHIFAFSFLFIISIIVFFIAGLYDNQVLLTKKDLPTLILNAQLLNSIIAVVLFYFFPFLGLTPKTNLFLFLVVSSIVIVIWRQWGTRHISFRRYQNAILLGSGEEMEELEKEIRRSSRYGMTIVSSFDLGKGDIRTEKLVSDIREQNASLIVIDLEHEKIRPILSDLYSLIFSEIRFVNFSDLYADIFGRIPISLVRHEWFLENVSSSPHIVYDFLKRLMDISLSLILGLLSLLLYPFVYLLIKIDDGGGLWSVQERVGRHNVSIQVVKFRTMSIANDRAEWNENNDNKVTRVGKFLRQTRIDELPQLWNVLKGDLSLIGPRPEFPLPVKEYAKEIPFYNVRHLIKPGLSGWAQIYHEDHPHHGDPDKIRKTREKLSYDLYYIKHRSFGLDIKIALRTLQILLSRKGI